MAEGKGSDGPEAGGGGTQPTGFFGRLFVSPAAGFARRCNM